MSYQQVLVTGGAGFIGSFVVDLLIEKGYKVTILDDLSSGKLENVNKNAVFIQKSILDGDLEDVFKDNAFDFIVHLAAQKSVRKSVLEPILDANINILGSLNLLNLSVKYNIKKLVYSSTGGAIYGMADNYPTSETICPSPLSPYAISKLTLCIFLLVISYRSLNCIFCKY